MANVQFVTRSSRNSKIVDTSAQSDKLDKQMVANAFGAKEAGSSKGLDLFSVRHAMETMLTSSGGRPSLAGTTAQTKIPKIETDWKAIDNLTEATSVGLKHKPTGGQMAALLIHLALERIPKQEIESLAKREFA